MSDRAGKRVIVTGGAGFIGSNLVAEALRRDPGAHVVVVDDLRSGSFANLVEACDRAGVGPFTGDFLAESTGALDWDDVLDAVEPAAVFHLAAVTDTTLADERPMIEHNVEGFRGVLSACVSAGVPLVYASSAATYGAPAQARDRAPFPEEAAGRPNNVYGFSKWLMECLHGQTSAEYEAETGAPPRVVGLRYFNVFGPGEARKGKMASMAFQLARQVLAGGRPRIFVDGSQARDQVAVEDVVECTLAAAEPKAKAGVYNCGAGVATTFNEVADAVRLGLGVADEAAPTEHFEMPASVRAFYQDYTCADMSRTRAGLGFAPRRKPREAIARYAAFLAGRSSR